MMADHPTVGLLYLSVELLQEIISLVSGCSIYSQQALTAATTKVLCNVRSVCQHTNAVIEPLLFCHLIMKVDSASSTSGPHLTQLRDMAAGSTNACNYAKALTITHRGKHEDFATYVGELARALDSLCNVSFVLYVPGRTAMIILLTLIFSWTIDSFTPLELSTAIVPCIAALPKLVNLRISGSHVFTTTFPCLNAFKGLQILSIQAIDDTFAGLSTLIANNPGLLQLDLGRKRDHGGNPIPTLPDIFAFVTPGYAMRLQSISLSNIQIHIEPSMLPHLQSLESIQFHHHKPRIQHTGTPSIWKSLRNSGLNLRHIDLDYIDDALLDYLASGSGLETLRITSSHQYLGDFTKGRAHRFFSAVLSRCYLSLKSLHISVPRSSDWCFCAQYSRSLISCERLISLSLSVPDDDYQTAVVNNSTLIFFYQ
jgi:hypothetical protein